MIAKDLGRAMLSEAQGLVDQLDRLEQFIARVRGDQVQEISIIAGAFAAESICIVAAARMAAHDPNWRLQPRSMNWADVLRAGGDDRRHG